MFIYFDLLKITSGLGFLRISMLQFSLVHVFEKQLEYPAYAIFTTVIKEFLHKFLGTNGFMNADLVHVEFSQTKKSIRCTCQN